MNELFTALLGGAVYLSGYPTPTAMPAIQQVTHQKIVDGVCGGHECSAFAYYKHGVLYLDNRLNPQDNLYHASIVVHELVHYLQDVKKPLGDHPQCAELLHREYEAYGVQSAYLTLYGRYQPVGLSMHTAGCEREAKQ